MFTHAYRLRSQGLKKELKFRELKSNNLKNKSELITRNSNGIAESIETG